jgi:prophage antirepressor-like protein
MATNLIPFSHPDFGRVRVHLDERGDPWWVASDVCRALELTNTTEAIKALEADEKMTLSLAEGHSGQRGGAQFLSLISEPGLYRLIHKSRTPKAKDFQRWNFHDVLPAIRKTGKYELGHDLNLEKIELENKRLLASCLTDLANSGFYTPVRAALFKAEATSVLTGKPIVEYLPPVADDRDRWLTPTQLGERFNVSPKRIGMVLKQNDVHGTQDGAHRHSEPYWNITPHSERQVISYKYDPSVVIPVLKRFLLEVS